MGGDAGEFVLGIVLATAAAASLAMSMVVQRYALSSGADRIALCGLRLRPNLVWLLAASHGHEDARELV